MCKDCSKPAKPAPEMLDRAIDLARQGGLSVGDLAKKYRRAVGCAKCHQTGYRGRTVIAEMLEVTPAVAEALREAFSQSR